MNRFLLTPAVVFILCLSTVKAQFTVTSSTNATQMAQLLAGSGVTISNATVNCTQGTFNGSGTFTNGAGTSLGINSGVVLMTGDVAQVDSSSAWFASETGNGLNDADLDVVSPSISLSNDRCILEFDVVPSGDTLRFKYVFASEEYPDYVCSNFSDVFAFFVSGPNPLGGNYNKRNIALVPGTNLVVSINTINPGTPGISSGGGTCNLPGQSLAYSSLYVTPPANNPPTFDGHTVVLTATIAVVPCQTYRLKLAIADVFDQAFDSGVFLEAGSISSTNVKVTPQTAYGNSFQNSIEGCVDAQFKFVINPPLPNPYTINYTIAGTATNGVDYTNIGTSVTIPAGDTAGIVNISPVLDGIPEGTETVKLYLLNPCNNLPYDSAIINIQDSIYADATADRYFICAGEQAALTGLGGVNYQWAPAGSLTAPSSQFTIATPTVTTTYSMTASIGACIGRDTLTIHVSNANFTVDAGANQSVCANQSVQLQPVVTQGAAPYTYAWSPTTYMAAGGSTQLNPVVTPLQTTTYTVTVSSANGCKLSDSVTITVAGVGPPVNASVTPSLICPGQQVQLDFTSDPQACGVSYVPGCAGTPKIDTIKTGYNVQSGNPYTMVTLYGNFYKSMRTQMLYTASELQSILGGGGTISQLSWQIGVFNSNASLENFTISLKCVPASQTTLTTWETGMKQVFGPKVVTPTVVPSTNNGWNTHALDSLYDWDGQSGLVVEICYYSPNTSSNLVNMMTYSNIPNRMLYVRSNNNECGTSNTPTSFAQRPNMRVRICQANYAAYSIAWTPASGPNTVSNPAIKNPTANPTSTQTYQVSVSYNGCIGSDFVTVNIDTTVKVNAGPDQAFCGGQQVQLSATPSGSPLAGQSFSYQWRVLPSGNLVGITQNVNVTPTGITDYVVEMSGGPCPVYDTVRVSVGILGVTHVVTPITCNGANNGKIDLNAAGTAPYTYQWSANAGVAGNIDSAINLATGTYYATVTDGQNCVGRDTVVLTQPTPVTFTSTVKNVSCNAGTDGRIALVPGGGTGAYTFNWSNAAPSNDTAYNLTAGAYIVTVYDANNCSATGSFTVTEPTALTFNAAQTKDIRCFNGNDGFITVAPTGGTQPYTYVWSHNAQLNQPNATNLSAATYTVTVTDANGCTNSETHTLTQPANGLTIGSTSQVDATCYQYNDGSATVTPAGGVLPYAYLWSGNANNQTTPTATALTAGTYTVTVTDDSLCNATATITVNEPQQITVNEAIQDVACNGDTSGQIVLATFPGVTPTNIYTYTWSNGFTGTDTSMGAHLQNVPAGSYSVTVVNSANCSITAGPYVVQEPPVLALNAATIQNVSCFGGNNGSITANPTGGVTNYNYAWSNAATTQTASALIAGNYTVTVTDANGCTVTASYTVTQPLAALAFGPPTIVNVLCNGAATGAITIVVDGGTPNYSYGWSHNNALNSATASGLLAGNYTVTATDANGCSISATHTITQPAAITFGAPVITDVSCFGGTDGTAAITPSGGVGTFTYSWNGVAGTNPQTGLAANTYTVVVTDSNSCTASTTVVVGQPAPLFANPIPTDATCYQAANGTIDANPAGGNSPFTYIWSNGQTTQVATALTAGTYTVTVTDATGCTADSSGTVGEPTELMFRLWPTQVSCPGDKDGTIRIEAWGATPPYNFSATQDGANFFFTTDTVIRDLAPGLYTVIVADFNGCTKQDTTTVPDAVHDDYLLSVDSTSCYGAQYKDGEIHIEGTTVVNMPYQYSLDGGPNQYSGDFFFVGAGSHTIVLTNKWGCTLTVDTIVPEPVDAYTEVFPGDTTLQVGESIQLSSTFGPYPTSTITSYNWTPSTGLSCIDCPNPLAFPYDRQTEYTLVITYNGLCVTSSSMTILVENDLEIYIPNAFSPNGDGNNDEFRIYGQGIKTVQLDIFNRWGEKIYETTSQFAGWDGTYKGILQNPGVFVYNVKITFLDNRQLSKTGSISIIR